MGKERVNPNKYKYPLLRLKSSEARLKIKIEEGERNLKKIENSLISLRETREKLKEGALSEVFITKNNKEISSENLKLYSNFSKACIKAFSLAQKEKKKLLETLAEAESMIAKKYLEYTTLEKQKELLEKREIELKRFNLSIKNQKALNEVEELAYLKIF